MSRYPFNDRIEEFLSTNMGEASQQSIDIGRNRLHNIGRVVHLLKENGTIQSDNPARMVPDDIQCFVDERRAGGVSESTISRDLRYLYDYLGFHHNDAVEEYLEEQRTKGLEEKRVASEKALRRIFLKVSKETDDIRLIRAYSFVMLAIVLCLDPEKLRKARLINRYENGLVNNYHIMYVDEGMERDVRLDLVRLPVVGKYIDLTFRLSPTYYNPKPLFPSSNPLFDYISPEESRELKRIVEKDIGCIFDYDSCSQQFLKMLEDDSSDEPSDTTPQEVWTPPVKRSILDRILCRRCIAKVG